MADPVEFIRNARLGSRLTVRRRIDGGFTDAVGYLRECEGTVCVIETRHGLVSITLADVAAVKAVPPPPPRRAPRFPPS